MQLWRVSVYLAQSFISKQRSTYFRCPEINMQEIPFKYGRQDCETSPNTDEVFDFPSGSMDRTELMQYFSNHFGYTSSEVRL